MTTLLEFILEKFTLEEITGITFGVNWSTYSDEDEDEGASLGYVPGQVLTVQEAMPVLTRPFRNIYGIAGCPPMYVWTKTHLLTIKNEDGLTYPKVFPLVPTAGLFPDYT